MARITISTNSPEELRRLKRIIADNCKIERVKGPKIGENGRLNYYIFVKENQPKARE